VKLLKSEKVAAMLDVSPSTLSRMCSSGNIPHIILRSGIRKKTVRFRESDLDLWIKQRTLNQIDPPSQRRKRRTSGNAAVTQNTPILQAVNIKGENGNYTVSLNRCSEKNQ